MTKPILYLIAGLALVLLLASLMQKCSDKATVTEHQGRLLYARKMDSLKTAEIDRQKAKLDSLALALRAEKAQRDTVYKEVVRLDKRLEVRYRERPTLPLCDSVIDSKNSRIGVLEFAALKDAELVTVLDSTIKNRERLVLVKDATISDLSEGYSKAINDLEKLGRKRIVVTAGVGAGVGMELKPQPYVGVAIGYKLFEF